MSAWFYILGLGSRAWGESLGGQDDIFIDYECFPLVGRIELIA